MGRDPEEPDSLEDIEKEARDLIEEDENGSVFSAKEILLTLREKFRMKRESEQETIIDNYKEGISRREFLKIMGLTAGATYVTTSGAGFLMNKKVYSDHTSRTITGMAQGDCSQEVLDSSVTVGDGETLSDVVLNMNDGWKQIAAKGSNWTIRNVGIKGEVPEGCRAVFGVAESGGSESLIENVYFGDGAEETPGRDETCDSRGKTGAGITGFWADDSAHNGKLTFRYCNIQGMADNGIYASAPKGSGSIHIENCYAANNYVACYRLAQGSISNSVAYYDNEWYAGRPVWVWEPGGVNIENSHFDTGPDSFPAIRGDGSVNFNSGEYSGPLNGSVNTGSGVGNNPDLSIPDGVPQSPDEAVCGEVPDSDVKEPKTGSWVSDGDTAYEPC